MKIQTKRILLIAALFCAAVWDYLCLRNIIPFGYFRISVAVVVLSAAISAVGEKSKRYSELSQKEKALSGLTITMAFAWLVTFLACIAYEM